MRGGHEMRGGREGVRYGARGLASGESAFSAMPHHTI